jgi:hypothetical protein
MQDSSIAWSGDGPQVSTTGAELGTLLMYLRRKLARPVRVVPSRLDGLAAVGHPVNSVHRNKC